MYGFSGERDTLSFKNKLDVNIFPLIYGHFQVGYERMISNQVAMKFIPGKIEYFGDNEHGEYFSRGYSLEMQLKKYFINQESHMPKLNVFLSIYAFYRHEYIKDQYLKIDEDFNDIYLDRERRLNAFGAGLITGLRFIQHKRFTTDLYIGIGYRNDNYTNWPDSAGPDLRGGISFGILF